MTRPVARYVAAVIIGTALFLAAPWVLAIVAVTLGVEAGDVG